MKKKYKIGVSISGLGVGELHMRNVIENKKSYLNLVYDPDNYKVRKIKKKIHFNDTSNFKKLVSNNKTDILVIASPDDKHVHQIEQGLKYKKHIFCEKPLCNSEKEIKRIYEAYKINNKKYKIKSNLVLRTADIYKWLKNKISENYFGEIYSIDAEYLYGRKEKIINGWRGKAKNYTGMKGGGVHMVDIICWITGKLPKYVRSFGNNIALKKYNLKHNDFMTSILTFDNGLVAQVSSNLASIHKHHHLLRIYGSKKTFIYDDNGPRVFASRAQNYKPKKLKIKTLPKNKSLLLNNFIDLIKKNKILEKDTIYEFNLINILNACHTSLKKGKNIKINYFK